MGRLGHVALSSDSPSPYVHNHLNPPSQIHILFAWLVQVYASGYGAYGRLGIGGVDSVSTPTLITSFATRGQWVPFLTPFYLPPLSHLSSSLSFFSLFLIFLISLPLSFSSLDFFARNTCFFFHVRLAIEASLPSGLRAGIFCMWRVMLYVILLNVIQNTVELLVLARHCVAFVPVF